MMTTLSPYIGSSQWVDMEGPVHGIDRFRGDACVGEVSFLPLVALDKGIRAPTSPCSGEAVQGSFTYCRSYPRISVVLDGLILPIQSIVEINFVGIAAVDQHLHLLVQPLIMACERYPQPPHALVSEALSPIPSPIPIFSSISMPPYLPSNPQIRSIPRRYLFPIKFLTLSSSLFYGK